MEPGAGPGPRNGLRDIHSQGHDRQAYPETHAHRILQRGATNAVEGIAVVEKGGDAEVPREVADHFDRTRDDILAADFDAAGGYLAGAIRVARVGAVRRFCTHLLCRRQGVVSKSAHTVIPAGEESLDDRQLTETRGDGRTDLIAQQQV